MDVLVVACEPATRWAVAATLGLPAAAACPPDEAASRLAHPSTSLPDVVLLVVADRADVLWLRRQVARRHGVPVVAATRTAFADAARRAGATSVVAADGPASELARALVAATAPAVVVDLDTVRSA